MKKYIIKRVGGGTYETMVISAEEWVGVCCQADGTDRQRTKVCKTWREAETLAVQMRLPGERVRSEPADGIGGVIELMD